MDARIQGTELDRTDAEIESRPVVHVGDQGHAGTRLEIEAEGLELLAETESLQELPRQAEIDGERITTGREGDRRAADRVIDQRFQVAVCATAIQVVAEPIHQAAHGVGSAGGEVVVENRCPGSGTESQQIAQGAPVGGADQTVEGQIGERHLVAQFAADVELAAQVGGGPEGCLGTRHVDDVGGIARLGRRHRGQQVIVTGCAGRQGGCFQQAGGFLECPVASQRRRASAVVGGRHVGSGEAGQAVHKGPAGFPGRNVTTVDEQVGIRREPSRPARQALGVGVHIAGVEHRGTQLQLPGFAVGEDMHGAQGLVLILAEPVGDLVHTVAGQIEHDHLDLCRFGQATALQGLVKELLIVGDTRVDEHDFIGAGGFRRLLPGLADQGSRHHRRQVDGRRRGTAGQQQGLLPAQQGLRGRIDNQLLAALRRRR